MAVTFTTADRVGSIGGYIGGITSLLGMLGSGGAMVAGSSADLDHRFAQAERISTLIGERDMLLSDQRNDGKMLELYKYLDAKDKAQSEALAEFKAHQAVVNAQVSANIAVAQSDIARLRATVGGLTKTVIPIDNICPEPAVATPTAATGGGGASA